MSEISFLPLASRMIQVIALQYWAPENMLDTSMQVPGKRKADETTGVMNVGFTGVVSQLQLQGPLLISMNMQLLGSRHVLRLMT